MTQTPPREHDSINEPLKVINIKPVKCLDFLPQPLSVTMRTPGSRVWSLLTPPPPSTTSSSYHRQDRGVAATRKVSICGLTRLQPLDLGTDSASSVSNYAPSTRPVGTLLYSHPCCPSPETIRLYPLHQFLDYMSSSSKFVNRFSD